MGKIDFNNLKKQQSQTDCPQNTELLNSYNLTGWGNNKDIVENISLDKIVKFTNFDGTNQPFKINENKIKQIKLSAEDIGIITPLIVRRFNGKYQIISGHHRYEVAKSLNLSTIPCIIKNIDDTKAIQFVVESNIQRVEYLPSEKANIYKSYSQIRKDSKMTMEDVANKFGIKRSSIYLYIHLSEMSYPMQTLFDENKIMLRCADILYVLDLDTQLIVSDFIKDLNKKVDVKLAKKIVELIKKSEKQEISVDFLKSNIVEVKKEKPYKNNLYNKIAEKYSCELSEEQLDNLVLNFLEQMFNAKNTQ